MLTGTEGGISSKRGVMIWFVLLFTVILFTNVFTGKLPNHDLMVQLFELTLVSMGLVFGEPFINLLAALRGQKTTSTTTTVAPPDSPVITTTVTKEPEIK